MPNSSGASGSLRVYGSEIVADDALRLVAAALPPEPNVGYFVMGPGTSVVTPPGSAGPLCVGPGVLRFPGVHDTSEADGGFAQEVGTRGPVSGAITPGSTWGFQAWHRDQAAGSSNLTDAARVTFR